MKSALNINSFYSNTGNPSVLQFIDKNDRLILDVGCGAGDTGKLILSVYPNSEVVGITCSQVEYNQASQNLSCCININVEIENLPDKYLNLFDVLIFSHVLEHLINPTEVLYKLLPYLKPNGKIIIALPNIANWRERVKLIIGKFEYTDGGVMDKTHLHFYTYYTAPKYLINPIVFL